jgi:hypothetical protein
MVRLVNAFDLNSEEYRGQVFPTARDPSPELIEINELLKRIEIEIEVLR